MKINEVIVVEGYHDATRLKQFFEVEVIVTNGSALTKKTLNLIKQVNAQKGVIIFVDPDYAGEKIRKQITNEVKDCKHAFLAKKDAISYNKKKIGIEHASKIALENALKNCVTFGSDNSLSWEDFLSLGFIGNQKRRQLVCEKLKISLSNAKTLYRRFNMLGLSLNDIERILGEICEK